MSKFKSIRKFIFIHLDNFKQHHPVLAKRTVNLLLYALGILFYIFVKYCLFVFSGQILLFLLNSYANDDNSIIIGCMIIMFISVLVSFLADKYAFSKYLKSLNFITVYSMILTFTTVVWIAYFLSVKDSAYVFLFSNDASGKSSEFISDLLFGGVVLF